MHATAREVETVSRGHWSVFLTEAGLPTTLSVGLIVVHHYDSYFPRRRRNTSMKMEVATI